MKQSGNVLFLILIAILLFAALSYAITQSTRSNGDGANKEKIELLTSRLFQWFALADSTVQRMRLVRNVPIDGFDFNVIGSGWYDKCSDSSCVFYDHRGGDMPKFDFRDEAFWLNGSGACTGYPSSYNEAEAYVVRIKNVGHDDLGDVVLYRDCVSLEVCRAFNRKVGLGNVIPLDSGNERSQYNFVGGPEFPEPSGTGIIGDTATELAGKKSFCFFDGSHGGQRTVLIHTIIER